MGGPILMNRELLVSGFRGRGLDRAARHYRDQVRAVFGAAVKVTVQSLRRHRQTIERLRRESLLERLLERGDAEYAFGPGARDGHPHVRRTLCDEHPDQRVARGLVAEFDVGGLL